MVKIYVGGKVGGEMCEFEFGGDFILLIVIVNYVFVEKLWVM